MILTKGDPRLWGHEERYQMDLNVPTIVSREEKKQRFGAVSDAGEGALALPLRALVFRGASDSLVMPACVADVQENRLCPIH